MKFGVPWSVKGIRPEARETAREAARRSGMSLGDWLNSVILTQAEDDGVQSSSHAYEDDDSQAHELSAVHHRLDDLTRRIEHFSRTGPAAYAPKQTRNDSDQIAELIGRLDRRLDQFVNAARPAAPPPVMQPAPMMMPPVQRPIMPGFPPQPLPPVLRPAVPSVQLPLGLDRAIAEIAARQRALNNQPALNQQTSAGPARSMPQAPMPTPAPPPMPSPALAPVPTQDLSGLEDQLRKITNQIETLHRPGVEEAINALRAELGDIARALTDAMPRQAIDTIERQIQGLTQRIAEGRQAGNNLAGVDGNALSGVEHGLAEVRDALRGLTPAENLVGFNDAVAGLAHKIDLIVAQKDPETLAQLEHAITTLRDMAAHVASTDAVGSLATQVHMLGEKVDHMAATAPGSAALNNLEQRISALSDALAERSQSGATVPPMLEALVQSLSDKIEMIQQSRGDNVAAGHLEDQIVALVQRLDASDSRLGHLEAIERGLADLLVHIEEIRANKDASGLRQENTAGVVELKHDIARTQDALDAVHGTLGHVVDRLVMIENGIRGEGRKDSRKRPVSDEEFAEALKPIGKVAVRAVIDPPPQAAAPPPPPPPVQPAAVAPPAPPPAPKRLPPAGRLPINPDLPPDQPLEPGSGAPAFRANPAARIAASEAALGSSFAGPGPAAAGPAGKSGFIAAARRAANAAVQAPAERAPRAELFEAEESEPSSLRTKMLKRVKSLFIAASIAGVVVGTIQIAGNFIDFGKPDVKIASSAEPDAGTSETATPSTEPAAPASVAALPLATPQQTAVTPPAAPATSNFAAISPPFDLTSTAQNLPSLLNPPVLSAQPSASKSDVTGSISRAAPARPPVASNVPTADRLPIAIGGPKLRSAAVAGDGAAAYEVGVRFAEGRGVPVSLEEAARWFERAANKGVTPAQFRYASLLEKGQGVKKDLVQARRLYLAAATKGSGKAMHNLAVLYAEGIEGKPDYATAAQWFRKAAQRGIADSQYNLGVLCARGLGTEKSVPESYKWFALAAAQGDRESAKKRDEIAAHLNSDALAAADLAVRNFVAEPQPADANTVSAPAGGWDNAATAPPARTKARTVGPLSLGALQVGKR
jgi:localization factor PodJL